WTGLNASSFFTASITSGGRDGWLAPGSCSAACSLFSSARCHLSEGASAPGTHQKKNPLREEPHSRFIRTYVDEGRVGVRRRQEGRLPARTGADSINRVDTGRR